MGLIGIFRRALSAVTGRSAAETPDLPSTAVFDPLAPEMHDLMGVIDMEVRKNLDNGVDDLMTVHERFKDHYESSMRQYRDIVLGLTPDTARALVKASSHDDFIVSAMLCRMPHTQEAEIIKRAQFHSVLRDYNLNYYDLDLALDRMGLVDERFTACTYAELDEASMKQALALFRVIAHFNGSRGFPSPDTSAFLREEPDMADEVIEYLERRGVGVSGFDMELFKMSRETTHTVLDSGVL